MSDCSTHCPFLNRADARCSRHFSLDNLGHAFEYCFDYYEGCGVYLELLVERRVRRARGYEFGEMQGAGDGDREKFVQVTIGAGLRGDRKGNSQEIFAGRRRHEDAALADRIAHTLADASAVSHASGV